MRKLIRSKRLLVDAGTPLIQDGAILVEEGRVVYSGAYEGVKGERYEEVINLGDRLLMPAFVNSHTHLAMILMRGLGEGLPLKKWLNLMWKVEGSLNEEDIEIGSLVGLSEMVASGISAFMDFYNVPPVLKALKQIKARAVITLAFMDRVRYMEEESWRRLKLIRRYADMAKRAGAKLVIGPHAPYTCSKDLLYELAKVSEREGLMVHTHLAETKDEVKLSLKEHGKRPLRLLDDVGLVNERLIAVHGVHLNREEIGLLSKVKAKVVHCPRSNSRLGAGIAPVEAMLRAGITVALGTDGPASGENFDMFEEMRAALYVQRGRISSASLPSIRSILEMATSKGAETLSLPIGSLRPGNYADFISVDVKGLEPTWDVLTSAFYSLNKSSIERVYIGGELVAERGRIIGLGYEELRRRMKTVLEKLIEASGKPS